MAWETATAALILSGWSWLTTVTFVANSLACSRLRAAHPQALTRIAAPLPQLPYGCGSSAKIQWWKRSPYPQCGYWRPISCIHRTDSSDNRSYLWRLVFIKAWATAMVMTVSSVKKQSGWKNSKSFVKILFHSNREPTISPIMAPINIFISLLMFCLNNDLKSEPYSSNNSFLSLKKLKTDFTLASSCHVEQLIGEVSKL